MVGKVSSVPAFTPWDEGQMYPLAGFFSEDLVREKSDDGPYWRRRLKRMKMAGRQTLRTEMESSDINQKATGTRASN